MTIEELFVYLRILKKRWWLIVILVGATVGSLLFISYTSDPQYEAFVYFQVTGTPPGAVALYSGYKEPTVREELGYTRNNFLQVLQSYNVAWETIQTLELDMSPEDLMEQIVLEQVKGSDLVKLSIVADDQELAADLVNTVMDITLQLYGQLSAKPLTDSREFISQRLAEAREDLETTRENLTRFKIENKVSSGDLLISSQLTLIRNLTLDRDSAMARGDAQQAFSYDKIIAERQLELQDLFVLAAEYSALEHAFLQAGDLYNYLVDKETEATLKENEAFNLSFVQLLGAAHPPSQPLPPINFKILVLAIGISLVFGVGLAFLWEYLETTSLGMRAEEEPVIVSGPDTAPPAIGQQPSSAVGETG